MEAKEVEGKKVKNGKKKWKKEIDRNGNDKLGTP